MKSSRGWLCQWTRPCYWHALLDYTEFQLHSHLDGLDKVFQNTGMFLSSASSSHIRDHKITIGSVLFSDFSKKKERRPRCEGERDLCWVTAHPTSYTVLNLHIAKCKYNNAKKDPLCVLVYFTTQGVKVKIPMAQT